MWWPCADASQEGLATGAKGPDLIGDGEKRRMREHCKENRDAACGLGPLRGRFTTNPRWCSMVKICTLDPLLGLFLWLVALACVLFQFQIRVAGVWTSHQSGEMRFCWAAAQGCLLLRLGWGWDSSGGETSLSQVLCSTDDEPT